MPAVICGLASSGCNSIMNSWLDPSVVGSFKQTATLDIRQSLTLEDPPSGVPGSAYPTAEDNQLIEWDFPIAGGDTLAIEIHELRQRQVPYQAQIAVSPSGYVNLPVVGRVRAAGLTPEELEQTLAQALRERDVLVAPEVTVNPIFLSKATYSIFGIGVSASNNAPLRAGIFPIRRPDLRLLEAINQVGGLNEFVTEVYIFRNDDWTKEAHIANGEISQGASIYDENSTVASSLTLPSHELTGNKKADPPSPIDELLGSLDEVQPHAGEAAQPHAATDPNSLKVPENLEPDITDSYIFVDGEFLPNPAFHEGFRPGSNAAASAPSFETIIPAVSWSRVAGDSSHRVIQVPAELLRTGDVSVNIFVRPGDVIRISSGEIGVYYVMGQVNRVGSFRFDAEPVTLKGAIAAAGGLSSLAWPDRCSVYRRIGQREQMIQVDLDRIFAGKDSDFTIKRGDIINVGTHPFAPFLQVIRGLTIPNPISNVGYSFTYARNFADIDSFAVQQNPNNEPDVFPRLLP